MPIELNVAFMGIRTAAAKPRANGFVEGIGISSDGLRFPIIEPFAYQIDDSVL